ncbi:MULTISPECIES: polyprenyl synthetase [unclassified Streptomyces]|uniref:polyprenyl synthetase n=1 Tax=unclassified Streptomyces TaxID=2593676 RepID=UPI000A67E523|nr:polyprenyl synthetase [Streptomyces sp. NRRL F-2747]
MSQTGHEQPAQPGPEQDSTPGGPPVTLELLALLAAGVADLALDQLRQSADRAQEVLRRSDLRELLTDGVVELRKRGELATRRSGAGAENHLEAMARRAAERVASEGHPRA